jgi:uncharacterized protein YggE
MQYKYLVWAGTGVLVILAIFLLTMIDHISNTATNANMISFSGEGKVFVKPDIAVISFSILTEAPTSKVAQDSNSQKSKKVVDFIKSQGIDDKDVKTTGYNVYPQYSYPQPMPMGVEVQSYPAKGSSGVAYPEYYPSNPKITGYQVNQSFEVKVRDLEKVSTILDGLVTAGANQVNNLGFQVDDIEKVKNEAREKAIEDAKAKANSLKKQLGIRLGKIVNFSEGGYYPPMYFKAEAMDTSGRGGGGPLPEIPAGENEVVINVTITYQIK